MSLQRDLNTVILFMGWNNCDALNAPKENLYDTAYTTKLVESMHLDYCVPTQIDPEI